LRFEDIAGEGDALRFKAAYHTSDVDDLINLFVVMPPGPPATCFFPPFVPCSAGTATSQNVDAKIRGGELEAEYESHRIAVNFNYSTLKGHERGTTYDLSSLTPNRLNTTFILKVPEIDISLGARLEFAGAYDKQYNPATHSPDVESRDKYSIVDLFGTWQPTESMLDGLRVDLGIENVGDAEYTRTFEGVLEPGRNFKAAISYTTGW
jgi:hemoglobin/transferrin/lactoferrin receptor protein